MLVDQLFSIRDVAPSGCQPAYLITEVLFLVMLQVRIFSFPRRLIALASIPFVIQNGGNSRYITVACLLLKFRLSHHKVRWEHAL